MSKNWRENLRAAIGMSGLIKDVEIGRTPADFFRMGAGVSDAQLVVGRLRNAIRMYGPTEVLDQCVSAFLNRTRNS